MTTRVSDNPQASQASVEWVAFTACSAQAGKLPVSVFEMPDQQAKKHHSAQTRWMLFQALCSYANADGTNCRPGDEKLKKHLGWSLRQIIRIRAELEETGFLLHDGYHRNPGSRTAIKNWRLVLPLTALSALPFGMQRKLKEAAAKCADEEAKIAAPAEAYA